MTIDQTTVKRVAKLARIRMTDAELPPVVDKLNGILSWIAQLDDVDIDGVAPMTTAVPVAMPMRDDVVSDGAQADAVVANAPKTDAHFFVVPKVVD